MQILASVQAVMGPKDFKRWRKSLGLSQKEAAAALGLKRRVVQYYEKGERDGDHVAVPRSVRLACYALARGVEDYHGPAEDPDGGGHETSKPGKPAAQAAKSKSKGGKSAKSRTAATDAEALLVPSDASG